MRASTIGLAVGVVIGGVLASCSIQHVTDALACDGPADCPTGRSCIDGYCATGAGSQQPGCPDSCTTCDTGAMTCTIVGSNGTASCPNGWRCTIDCSAGGCKRVDCSRAESCTITCGAGACEDVDCGDGRCSVSCAGAGSCGSVDCHNSCGCDVTCTGAGSCDHRAECPRNECQAGNGCTSQGDRCNDC